MITILADHNIEGQSLLLWGALSATGWTELIPLRILRFVDVGLPFDSTDRTVWRFVQAHHMYLLTDNRNMDGEDSLEQTIRDENEPTSLPVITIGRVDRLSKRVYREACVSRLLEIILYPNEYVGIGRLFIP